MCIYDDMPKVDILNVIWPAFWDEKDSLVKEFLIYFFLNQFRSILND